MKKLLFIVTTAVFLTGCGQKFPPASQWQTGQERAKEEEWKGKKSISWLQTFGLPKQDEVIAYLERSGLKVGRIEPVAYEDSKTARIVTYQVFAVVPARLYKMSSHKWHPKEKDLQRFGGVLVFNPGLPAGEVWDTESARVAAEPGKKLAFTWRITQDKIFNATSTDALVFGDNLFTEQQVNEARSQTAQVIASLQGSVAQIKSKVAEFKAEQLAKVPADPPPPEMRSKKWGGSGSGEPTKTGVRAVGGAATGAAIGGIAAGGEGAGIGAGAGLLGGLVYDAVSKSNDREEFEKEVNAENSRRREAWKAQKRELAARRAEIAKQAAEMEEQLMSQLEATLASNSGKPQPSSAETKKD